VNGLDTDPKFFLQQQSHSRPFRPSAVTVLQVKPADAKVTGTTR
jgi:hypothetical protein